MTSIRYGCTLVGGALAGVGGAYLSLAYTTMWIEQMSGGRGWIALAPLMVFLLYTVLRFRTGVRSHPFRPEPVSAKIPL